MPPKKALKKAARKHAPPPERDLRRGYEHLGRIQKILALVPEESRSQLVAMVQLARDLIRNKEALTAADLLRAAEHVAFASMDSGPDEPSLSRALAAHIKEELQHLQARAEEHWKEAPQEGVLLRAYENLRKLAAVSAKAKKFREALEAARGAEALTNVRGMTATAALPAKTKKRSSAKALAEGR